MKSQRIAVAGGTGKLGKHIVEGLLEVKDQYSLQVIALSRSPSSDITYAGASAPVIAVDYQSQESIQKVLEEHQIDTIISTLSGAPEAFISAQINLLRAGLSVPSFRRFAPSEFASDTFTISKRVKLFEQLKLPIIQALQEAKRDTHSRPNGSFEYTLFNCGLFMNYLGYGNTKPDGQKALGYLGNFPFMFDLSTRTAEVPADGEKQLAYTRAEDVGKFVAAATQLDVWEEYSDMVGDIVTINEVISLCDDVCGMKLDVKWVSRESYLSQIDHSNPAKMMENFVTESRLAILDGLNHGSSRPINLNKQLAVKPMTVKEFLREWWA